MQSELAEAVLDRWARYAKIGESDACWSWDGPKDRDGYGRFKLKGVVYRAHRVALWAVETPPSPEHLACHRCDNPGCCNPAHLWWGTNADNLRDRDRKGRQVPPAKLTEDEVREIRARLREGHKSKDLAEHFGVHRTNISLIKSGKIWGSVK